MQDTPTRKQASHEWYPFVNELEFLLFMAYNDKTTGVTRQTLEFIISLLRTLQKNGHLHHEYFVPKTAVSITRLWQYLVEPPISMCFYPCTQSTKSVCVYILL